MSNTKAFHLEVTNRIVELMEMSQGTNRPFLTWTKTGKPMGMPTNLSTNNKYNGVNVLILNSSMIANGFKTNQWVTMKQANFMGYKVAKGSVATAIALYKPFLKVDKENDEEKVISFLNPFNVFNVDQLEGYEVDESENQAVNTESDILVAEQYLDIANVEYGHDVACYIPSKDLIKMPAKDQFMDISGFYNVALHELTHWTAHKSRLARSLSGYSKDNKDYAYEELVAEIGSAFLCADIGILQSTQDDHAQYLNSWIQQLKDDPNVIFKAAKDAQKAFLYIQEKASEKQLVNLPLAG